MTGFDVLQGIIKSILFGGAIAVIACHRGFPSGAGARASAPRSHRGVRLIVRDVLGIDFLLGTFLMEVYFLIFPKVLLRRMMWSLVLCPLSLVIGPATQGKGLMTKDQAPMTRSSNSARLPDFSVAGGAARCDVAGSSR